MKVLFSTVFLIISGIVCFAQNQSKAPEPGIYKGSNTVSGVTSTSPYPGAGVNEATYGVQSTSVGSVFGDLILNKDGTYKLTTGGEGTWQYDVASGTVTFTGKLSKSQIKYNYYPEYLNFQVSFPYNGQYIHSSFSKKRQLPYVKTKTPNAIFSGVIVAQGTEALFNVIDVTTGKSLKTGRGYHPAKNSNGEIVSLSSFNDASDIYVYDKNGELKLTVSGQKIVSSGIINRYYSASISPNGQYLALAGTIAAYSIAGDPVYAIIDIKGNPILKISVGFREGWTPQWTDDNQVLISGRDKVALVNPVTQTVKTLLSERVDYAALSQNKQKLAFVKNKVISVLNLSTGTVEPFAGGKHDELLAKHTIKSIAWSADDNSLACNVQGMMIVGYKIILLSADGSNAKYLSNDNGEDWTFKSGYLGW